MSARIDRLSGSPTDCLGGLIAESQTLGLGFLRRLADEWVTGANRFDAPGEVLLVARIDDTIVGVCGLNVDPYAGRQNVGRVRHLYVLQAHRRRGVGRQLVAAVLRAARGRFDRLHLRTGNPDAARLYEELGFRPVGADHDTHVLELGA
jgi:GNAT superfamily N-acetyltransferase